MSTFNRAFAFVIDAEGGFVNDPKDDGGATKYGVSLRAVRLRDKDRDGRLDFDLDKDGDVDEWDIRLVTVEDARRLYFEDYWNLGGPGIAGTCDKFPPDVGIALFDAAVNHGPRTAVALLQRALKVRPDGIVGPATTSAARTQRDVLPRFLLERAMRYVALKDAPHFLRGWLKRLFRLQAYIEGALEMRVQIPDVA